MRNLLLKVHQHGGDDVTGICSISRYGILQNQVVLEVIANDAHDAGKAVRRLMLRAFL